MKVLLVGATFNSNFGDLLFSHMFYNKCKKVGFEKVSFWQWPEHVFCDFCRNELDYHERISVWQSLRYDALILQSGGMMGDRIYTKLGVRLRFIRYFVPALLFTLLRKPVYILGCGGGPLYSGRMRKMAKFIWNRANRITVRDEETRDYFQSIGVTREIEVTTDTAQVITPQQLPPFDKSAELGNYLKGRKVLLFVAHFPKKGDAQESIILPAIRAFLQAHPDYALVVTTDKAEMNDKTVAFMDGKKDYFIYRYHDCYQLASLLNCANVIITLGLHIGIVSASLGKSVISFPHHYDKTHRYYKQIGESERCIELSKVDESIVLSQLEKFHSTPIVLSPQIRELAKKNLDIIDDMIL